MMENMVAVEPQAHRYQFAYRHSDDARHRSPRLPTPENSRSSNDAYDQSPSDAEPSLRDTALQPSSTCINSLPKDVECYQQSRRFRAGANPTPYQLADTQKPSLPSLKTVLGDRMSSPPRTPSPEDNILQPTPREPMYVTSTYMPPSLYPNKKQRIEPLPRALYPHNSMDGRRSPLPASRNLEPPSRRPSQGLSVQFSPLSATFNGIDTRRGSYSTHSSSLGPHFPSQHHLHDTAARHYRSPEQTPTCSMLEPAWSRMSSYSRSADDAFAQGMRGSLANTTDRPGSRRQSADGHNGCSARQFEGDLSQARVLQQDSRYSNAARAFYMAGGVHGAHADEKEQGRSVNNYGPVPYRATVPAFFMPSPYEYHHGKSRKRSNLPKQSTEIMKTWFDQNITNPYPSEEQKAVFSSATGISMTQVSNWFINHRRRCPELREKREKNRNGRDGET